ncbi:hypothetical protein [Oleidesulfovibrio sp.]|uniref:hypothetical protein n=1 Tax=Oleidesulfovibrio sp. TaxID=2909707 RepID=UPI003A8B29A1
MGNIFQSGARQSLARMQQAQRLPCDCDRMWRKLPAKVARDTPITVKLHHMQAISITEVHSQSKNIDHPDPWQLAAEILPRGMLLPAQLFTVPVRL